MILTPFFNFFSRKLSYFISRHVSYNNYWYDFTFTKLNLTSTNLSLFFNHRHLLQTIFLAITWWKSRCAYYLNNWIYTTNHKRIAINYFWFVILSGIVGMILATVIRLELAYPGVGIFAGDSLQYLSLVTAHGVVMVFFMIMPLLFGAFSNFLLPTQLGVHDVAFPRLNSAAFWFLPSGLIMLAQLICIDRRYQRMNCFNIREVEALLKRKFFSDLINSTDHRTLLNKSAIGIRYKIPLINETRSNIFTFYNYSTTFDAKTRTPSFHFFEFTSLNMRTDSKNFVFIETIRYNLLFKVLNRCHFFFMECFNYAPFSIALNFKNLFNFFWFFLTSPLNFFKNYCNLERLSSFPRESLLPLIIEFESFYFWIQNYLQNFIEYWFFKPHPSFFSFFFKDPYFFINNILSDRKFKYQLSLSLYTLYDDYFRETFEAVSQLLTLILIPFRAALLLIIFILFKFSASFEVRYYYYHNVLFFEPFDAMQATIFYFLRTWPKFQKRYEYYFWDLSFTHSEAFQATIWYFISVWPRFERLYRYYRWDLTFSAFDGFSRSQALQLTLLYFAESGLKYLSRAPWGFDHFGIPNFFANFVLFDAPLFTAHRPPVFQELLHKGLYVFNLPHHLILYIKNFLASKGPRVFQTYSDAYNEFEDPIIFFFLELSDDLHDNREFYIQYLSAIVSFANHLRLNFYTTLLSQCFDLNTFFQLNRTVWGLEKLNDALASFVPGDFYFVYYALKNEKLILTPTLSPLSPIYIYSPWRFVAGFDMFYLHFKWFSMRVINFLLSPFDYLDIITIGIVTSYDTTVFFLPHWTQARYAFDTWESIKHFSLEIRKFFKIGASFIGKFLILISDLPLTAFTIFQISSISAFFFFFEEMILFCLIGLKTSLLYTLGHFHRVLIFFVSPLSKFFKLTSRFASPFSNTNFFVTIFVERSRWSYFLNLFDVFRIAWNERPVKFQSDYFTKKQTELPILLTNEENAQTSRYSKFSNPTFKYDYKAGDYFPKLYKETYEHLLTSVINLSGVFKPVSWFFSENYFELFTTNASVVLYNLRKISINTHLRAHYWTPVHINGPSTFYGFFFNLHAKRFPLYDRFVNLNSLNQKFYKMFNTSSIQQRIYSNWRNLKFTREAWRCKLLSARHQKTLFRRYLHEDNVFWSLERNAKDLLPGWAMITPFSSRTRFTAIGKVDIGLMAVLLVLNSSLISAANFLITYRYLSTLNNRKMRDARSFFTEGIMVTSWMMIAANPMLVIGIIMLLSDRHWQTSFFDYSGGGDTILFQHMFWFFGHPEVYIIIIPVFGFTNTILSYYLKKRISARASLLYSMYTIAFLGFFVWGHHMYMVGLAHTTRMLFSTLTVMISVPAATKLMHWCVTIVNSAVTIELPFVCIITFIFFFISGGISGMFVAHTGMDVLFHDTFYVIGHFHVMIAGAAMIGSFGAFYFYFPAIFGVKYNRIYAYIHYVYYLLGQLFTLVPMFWLGYAGMPRRVLDYPASFGGWHSIISGGHMLSVAGMLAFFIMIFDSMRQAKAATRLTFGVGRYNTRLNFYIYEAARLIYVQQKSWSFYRLFHPKFLKLNTLNYSNFESLETTLYSYVFIKN